MPLEINFFGSLSSPYCYLALDRLDELEQDYDIRIVMRPVLPGVLRMSEFWADTPKMELTYFELDVARTAVFLGAPYEHPDPSPVEWVEDSVWKAGPDQARAYRLYNMLYQAEGFCKSYELYSSLMRLIWSGRTPDWDKGHHIASSIEGCGLPGSLSNQPDVLTTPAETHFASNQQALLQCGHWGVPTFSINGEPFFGQDRLDQLRWRIESPAS